MAALPVRRLPHCPDQTFKTAGDPRFGRYRQGLCLCPEPDAEGWSPRSHRVHWLTSENVPFYCHCGPSQEPPGSGQWGGVNPDGYVCYSCIPLLRAPHRLYEVPETLLHHRLVCDCRCCYCGQVAGEWSGWRLNGHPARREEVPTAVVAESAGELNETGAP